MRWPFRWLLPALLAMVLAGCGALPPRAGIVETRALTEPAGTALARSVEASRPDGEGSPSGFRLLPTGEYALDARLALVRRAERTLDLQYYHLHRDRSGLALLAALGEAAARGVRVRLLVDDFYAHEIADLLAGLAAHPGAQVRVFNPLTLRQGPAALRLLLSGGRFAQLNHRMHNKLFVADNALAVYGGRNIADAYFMSNPQENFIDLDVLAAGAVVRDLSNVFDTYWNSELAWPLDRLQPPPPDTLATFAGATRGAVVPAVEDEQDPLGQTPVSTQLAAGRLALTWAAAQVFADPPSKALTVGKPAGPSAAMGGLLQVIAGARREVAIVSPYFVPSQIGMAMMRSAAAHGVRTVLITNSLASTDVPLVHYQYSDYRVPMLRLGVQILEISPAQAQRRRSFGNFGRSTPRLHAKATLVDRRWVLVGSVNLDARSAIGNTEMAVVVDSPALAEKLSGLVAGDAMGSVYRLALAADDETLEWHFLDDEGREQVTQHEPAGGPWQQFKLWMQSLLVDEDLL